MTTPFTRKCPRCDSKFKVRRKDQHFCSRHCAIMAHFETHPPNAVKIRGGEGVRKITVRMNCDEHAKVCGQAARDRKSLNLWAKEKLLS